jgi:hypothetical protein
MKRSRCGSLLLGLGLLLCTASCSSQASDPAAGGNGAASGSPAATTGGEPLDLTQFPLAAGATEPGRRTLAGLAYDAPGTVKAVFESQRKELAARQWSEVPDAGYLSDESSSGLFRRGGYLTTLSVIPTRLKGVVRVNVQQLGNVPLDQLPKPADAKPMFVGPSAAMYVTESSVEQTAEACRALLAAQGWEPYGKVGDSLVLKKGTVRLDARVSSAPAQGGKTMISYSAELMSYDLPAPADAVDVEYTDMTATLMFDTKRTVAETAEYYRTALAKNGWKSTLEKPVEVDRKQVLIFRNPQKDLLELQQYDVEGVNRVILKFQSAAELAEIEKQIEEERAKNKAAAEKKANP